VLRSEVTAATLAGFVLEETSDAAAAASAAEWYIRGVASAEPPIDGGMEFGTVCSPESSKRAGGPMAKSSRTDGKLGAGGIKAAALSLHGV
jgi:hypothetical protein